MSTEARISTSFSTLEVEWKESSRQEQVGVKASDAVLELSNIGFVVGLTGAIAINLQPYDSPFVRAHQFGPKLLRIEFGSPLQVSLELGREIAASVGATAFLMYGLKRVWGLDLELKTRREEMRQRFLEAQLHADDAERRLDATNAHLKESREKVSLRLLKEMRRDDDAERHLDAIDALSDDDDDDDEAHIDPYQEIDEAQGWGRNASAMIEGARRMWRGVRATWHVDDD